MADYYSPKYGGFNNSYPTSALAQSTMTPTIELPKEGDKMLLHIQPHGTYVVGDGYQVPLGAEFVEVEVKAIKKAKINLE